MLYGFTFLRGNGIQEDHYLWITVSKRRGSENFLTRRVCRASLSFWFSFMAKRYVEYIPHALIVATCTSLCGTDALKEISLGPNNLYSFGSSCSAKVIATCAVICYLVSRKVSRSIWNRSGGSCILLSISSLSVNNNNKES